MSDVCVDAVFSPPQKHSGYYAAVITLPAFSCHNTKCLDTGKTDEVVTLNKTANQT